MTIFGRHEPAPRAVEVTVRCPECLESTKFNSYLYSPIEKGLKNMGWVETEDRRLICPECAAPTLTYAEAMKAMVEGRVVMRKGHGYRQYRIKDGVLQTRDNYACSAKGRWNDWEKVRKYPDGSADDRWKLAEGEK